MRSLPWKTRELLKMAAIALATVLVIVSAKLWPQYAWHIWGLFLSALAFHLYRELRKPVNYDSITVSEGIIEYAGIGGRSLIRMDEIAKLEFVREPALFGDYIESKWDVRTVGGAHIEMMDEWPHRKLLFRTFGSRLPGFDAAAARKGFRAWKAGRWLCFQR